MMPWSMHVLFDYASKHTEPFRIIMEKTCQISAYFRLTTKGAVRYNMPLFTQAMKIADAAAVAAARQKEVES
jgi:hypothetical protein